MRIRCLKPFLISLYLLFLLLFGISISSYGQYDSSRIDSLQKEIVKGQADTMLFHIYYNLAKIIAESNTDSAVAYAQELITVCNRLGTPEKQARSWRVLGEVYDTRNLLDSAVVAALKAAQEIDDCPTEECETERFYAIHHAASIRNRQNRRLEALEIIQIMLDHPFTTPYIRIRLLASHGHFHNQLGTYDKAILALREALELSQIEDDEYMESYLLTHLIDTYRFTNTDANIMSLARRMLYISKKTGEKIVEAAALGIIGHEHETEGTIDSALYYYQLQLDLGVEDKTSEIYAKAIYGFLRVYNAESDDKADYFVQEAEKLLDQKLTFKQTSLNSELYKNVFDYHYKNKNLSAAEQQSRAFLSDLINPIIDTSTYVIRGLQDLSKVLAAQGKHQEAWEVINQLYDLKIAVVNRNQSDILAQTAVEMELAENQLARQKAEQAALLEQQISASRSRFFVFLLVIAGIVLAVISWGYRRAQRDKQLIREKSLLVEQSLGEKEVLLREIHHRVKNNLQIISSLLDKQARKSSDATVSKLVKEGKERIQSMALIHQNLYESEQLSGINIKSYLQELASNIQKSQAVAPNHVQLELNVADEKLDIDTAIPVGLILNELLTNCYKYAFPPEKGGTIKVDFHKKDDQYFLQVSDDGQGFTPEQGDNKTKSLGLSLVRGLVRQLEGTLEWLQVGQGASVVIRF